MDAPYVYKGAYMCGKAGLEFMDVSLSCSGVYVYTYRTASGERPASW